VGLFAGRSVDSWISEYEGGHQHPVNRLCHTFGIPAILLSLPLFAGSALVPRLWPWAIGLCVAGWCLQLIGHAFEGRRPEFLRDWRFLFVGARWWWGSIFGRHRNP
jgi:uncharacterized membrane protein YGL010W